jgi:hypothetical protein
MLEGSVESGFELRPCRKTSSGRPSIGPRRSPGCVDWRAPWPAAPASPVFKRFVTRLENRYPSLGGSRVRIPPPPSPQAKIRARARSSRSEAGSLPHRGFSALGRPRPPEAGPHWPATGPRSPGSVTRLPRGRPDGARHRRLGGARAPAASRDYHPAPGAVAAWRSLARSRSPGRGDDETVRDERGP